MYIRGSNGPGGRDRGRGSADRGGPTDGVSFSRESDAELLGLADEDISEVSSLSTDGSKVVIAVSLTGRDDSDVRKQLVLVGTPRG